MRIGLIGDLHFGKQPDHKDLPRRLSQFSRGELGSFLESSSGFDFAVQLGDLIQRGDYKTDAVVYRRLINDFGAADCQVHHVIGNHEQGYLGEDDLRSWLGHEHLYYSFSCGDFLAIVLYVEQRSGVLPRIGITQLDWLQKQLVSSEKPVLVFIHHPLADCSLESNLWFSNQPEQCLVENRKEVRALFEVSGKVRAVFNGHAHWDNITSHNGIPYVTLNSAVEDMGEGMPARCWATLDLDADRLIWEVHGQSSRKVLL